MQTVRCKIPKCPFCSVSGFCLNRLVVINEQGVCNFLTRPDWINKIIEEYEKSTYVAPEQKNMVKMLENIGDNEDGFETGGSN